MEILNYIGAAVAYFLAFYVCHWLVWRLIPPGKKGLNLIAVLAVIVFIGSVAVVSSLNIETWSGYVWVSGAIYFLGIMLYVNFYSGIDRSVSVRLMGMMVENGLEHGLPLSVINQTYAGHEMVQSRLDLLQKKNFVAFDPQSQAYFCTPRGQRAAQIARIAKAILGVKETG